MRPVISWQSVPATGVRPVQLVVTASMPASLFHSPGSPLTLIRQRTLWPVMLRPEPPV